MQKNKLMVLGLATALCLIGMMDIGLGNGSLNKLIAHLFFTIIVIGFSIPAMMVQGALVLGMGLLLIGYTYWIGFAAWAAIWYWLKVRK